MSQNKKLIQPKLTDYTGKRKLSATREAKVEEGPEVMATGGYEPGAGSSKKFKAINPPDDTGCDDEDNSRPLVNEQNSDNEPEINHQNPSDNEEEETATDDGAYNCRSDASVEKGKSVDILLKAPDCYDPEYTKKIDVNDLASNQFLFKVPIHKNNYLPSHMEYKEKGNIQTHVYMPCSRQSQLPMKSKERPNDIKIVSRWEVIEKALDKTISGTFELQDAILSYNAHYKKTWSFENLHAFSEEYPEASHDFFTKTLPRVQLLAKQLQEKITRPIRLLKRDKDDSKHQRLMMTQEQAAILLANAFFCTFPRRNLKFSSRSSLLPTINFSSLFNGPFCPRKIQKLKCITHYFRRVTEKMPSGVISFTRQRITKNSWMENGKSFTDVHVTSGGTIEDNGEGMLQADFANKFLGGGVLGRGCVQEEIRFMICPEMILSRLFTEVLSDHEVLIMKGCERFSSYKGYGDTFKWAGDYIEPTDRSGEPKRDSWHRLYTEVVAMDAIHFKKGSDNQFSTDMVKRELMKAFCAFTDPEHTVKLPAVCTGNWGCGAFGGDTQLKALIQIIAASHANRQVCYFTFGDEKLCSDISEIIEILIENDVETDSVMERIKEFNTRTSVRGSLFKYIKAQLGF